MEWFDFTQIPAFNVPVLVTDGKRVLIARLETITKTKEYEGFTFLENETGYENLWITPTHWMPLPEPPK